MNSNAFNKMGGNPTIRETWKTVDTFDSTYWSGLDFDIYIGDVYIDESIQLNFGVAEKVNPYFAYNSYVASKIHHGSRLISGELSVNFKKDAYLYSLISYLQNGALPQALPPTSSNTYNTPNSLSSDVLNAINPVEAVASSQAFAAFLKGNNGATPSTSSTNTPYSNYSSIDIVSPLDIRSDKPLFDTYGKGFDIMIVFGAGVNGTNVLMNLQENLYRKTSNVSFVPDTLGLTSHVSVFTGLKLIGCHFTAQSRSMADDGRAIIETYNFIATDVRLLRTKENFPGTSQASSDVSVQVLQDPSNTGDQPVQSVPPAVTTATGPIIQQDAPVNQSVPTISPVPPHDTIIN